jgi:hypothetical protein
LNNIKQHYSLKGRANEATTTKDGDITLYLNNINLNIFNPEKNRDKFIAYLCAVELHEIGHLFNWKTGCNHGTQKKNGITECPWCEETYKIYGWLK